MDGTGDANGTAGLSAEERKLVSRLKLRTALAEARNAPPFRASASTYAPPHAPQAANRKKREKQKATQAKKKALEAESGGKPASGGHMPTPPARDAGVAKAMAELSLGAGRGAGGAAGGSLPPSADEAAAVGARLLRAVRADAGAPPLSSSPPALFPWLLVSRSHPASHACTRRGSRPWPLCEGGHPRGRDTRACDASALCGLRHPRHQRVRILLQLPSAAKRNGRGHGARAGGGGLGVVGAVLVHSRCLRLWRGRSASACLCRCVGGSGGGVWTALPRAALDDPCVLFCDHAPPLFYHRRGDTLHPPL